MPSEDRIERSPLWPLSPPPSLTRSVPKAMSSSSWIATIRVGRHLVERGQRLDRPAGLVHVAARPGRARRAARACPGAPSRPSTTSARPDLWAPEAAHPIRAASSSVDEVADVVPVPGVGRAGVAQPDDQPHVVRRSLVTVSIRRGGTSRAHDVDRRLRSVSEPRGGHSLGVALGLGAAPSAAALGLAASASAISASDSSRSMPASASASSSSASSASAECASVTLTMSVSASTSSVVPVGQRRAREARIWVPAAAPSMETSMNSGMWVASASTWTGGVLGDDQGLGGGLADEVDRDVDGDLLAAADGDEVDVLEDAADRVDLDLLGQRELLACRRCRARAARSRRRA